MTLEGPTGKMHLPLKVAKVVDVATVLFKGRVIAIAQNGSILVGGIPVQPDSVKDILARVAETQPTGRIDITIRYMRIGELTAGGDSIDTILKASTDLPLPMRRFWFSREPEPNKAPEPTPGSVTLRASSR